jgi:transcriptional regulator with XRE-family HTH domain
MLPYHRIIVNTGDMKKKERPSNTMSMEGDDQASFAARIAYVLDTRGITARQFASECGISPPSLAAYLKAESDPSRSNIIALSKASGFSVEWLVTGKGPRFTEQHTSQDYLSLAASYEAYRAEISGRMDEGRVMDQFVADYNSSSPWVVKVDGLDQITRGELDDAVAVAIGTQGMFDKAWPSTEIELPDPDGREKTFGVLRREMFGSAGKGAFTILCRDTRMSPAIEAGDIVVLAVEPEVTIEEIRDGGLYGFDAPGGDIVVRRVFVQIGEPGRIRLTTDRDDQTRGEVVDLAVTRPAGRVICVVRRMGL